MESSGYIFIENCGNDWVKYYDPSNGCYFYWNSNTQESSWVPPKKIFTENDQVVLPIDEFILEKSNQESTSTTKRKMSDVFIFRCNRCHTEENVRDHNFCDNCYKEINSYETLLIANYQIRCKGCCGWGINLVQPNGYCNICINNLRENKPIRRHESIQCTKNQEETPFPRCSRCGGWGKDLLQENGMCNYCIMVEEEKAFERKLRTRCNCCGGWGLDLVKEDGFCNYCRRNLIQKSTISPPIPIIKEENNIYRSYNEANILEGSVNNHEIQHLTKRRINELYGF
jgi:WW domain.